MKKLLLTLALALFAAGAANAQFFYGAQFGIYTDGGTKITDSGIARGRAAFNISVKPSVGYYFTPKLVAGLKLNFTSCTFSDFDGSFSSSSINSFVLNLLMGNGVGGDYLSWNASPYVRYQVLALFKDKLKLWAELDGYVGMRYSRDEEHKIDPGTRSLTYGVELHPLVSYDITDRYMLITSLDLLSFSWNGTAKRYTPQSKEPYTQTTSQFLFQANPLVGIARAFVNIGLMRKF